MALTWGPDPDTPDESQRKTENMMSSPPTPGGGAGCFRLLAPIPAVAFLVTAVLLKLRSRRG